MRNIELNFFILILFAITTIRCTRSGRETNNRNSDRQNINMKYQSRVDTFINAYSDTLLRYYNDSGYVFLIERVNGDSVIVLHKSGNDKR